MLQESSDAFPLTLRFQQDGVARTFTSAEDFQSWVDHENKFWGPIATNPGTMYPNLVGENVRFLQNAISAADPAIKGLENSYRPSGGTLGRLISRIRSIPLAAMTFAEIVQPGSNRMVGSDEVNAAKVYAQIYYVVADGLAAGQRVLELQGELEAGIADVTRIRVGDEAELARLRDTVDRVEKDWTNKIEGYEEKVRLGAPRDYWSVRAKRHETLATDAKWTWSAALVVTSVVIVALVVIGFSSYGDSLFPARQGDTASEIGSLVRRTLLLTTLLAFAVWWLRQQLRDLRSHEHLAEDAAERVTMIETYAAMKGAGLQDSDLSLILTALYRPATTGFIEDSGPVLPVEILMKGVGNAMANAGSARP